MVVEAERVPDARLDAPSVPRPSEDRPEGSDADGALNACVGVATVEPDNGRALEEIVGTEKVGIARVGDAMVKELCPERRSDKDRELDEIVGTDIVGTVKL